eukprot:jgi/Botrbrau1/14768/Bobra.0284s0002.1
MVLGLSYGELLLIGGAGFLLIGPRDLPLYSRLAGRAAGRAVAFINEVRSKLINVANDAEVTKLHEEIQQGLLELRTIRHELRSGINIMQPGPLAQNAFGLKPIPPEASSFTLQDRRLGGGPTSSHTSAGFTEGMMSAQSWHRNSEGVPTEEGVTTSFSEAVGIGGGKGQSGMEDGLQPMPVSAVMAGRVPDRSSSIPTGADIMLDAVAEEDVAHQALQFLKRQPGWRPP